MPLQNANFHILEHVEPENIISYHAPLFGQLCLYILGETRQCVTKPYIYACPAFRPRQKKHIRHQLSATLGFFPPRIATRPHAQPVAVAD